MMVGMSEGYSLRVAVFCFNHISALIKENHHVSLIISRRWLYVPLVMSIQHASQDDSGFRMKRVPVRPVSEEPSRQRREGEHHRASRNNGQPSSPLALDPYII